MALQANIVLDLSKTRTVNPKITLRQSDQNYPSIKVNITENGDAFNATGWTAAFEGTTPSGLFFIHDSDHFTDSDPARGEFTYTPPLQISSEIGTYSQAYFVFERDVDGQRERTTTADFKLIIIEQSDINKPAADDYVSQWQDADVIARSYAADMDAAAQEFYDHVSEHQDALDARITQANADLQDVLTSDNTYTGNNTHNGTETFAGDVNMASLSVAAPIEGSVATRIMNWTGGMAKILAASDRLPYTGTWWVSGAQATADALLPTNAAGFMQLEVHQTSSTNWSVLATYTEVHATGTLYQYTATFGTGTTSSNITWSRIADTTHSVQTTGNQSVADVKTFTGASTNIKGTLELGGTASGTIDIHGAGDASDYTHRITEEADGLSVTGSGTSHKLLSQRVLNATAVNFDAITISGEYVITRATTLTNGPANVTSPFVGLLNVAGGAAIESQVLYDSTTGHMYIRTGLAGKMTPWRDLTSGGAGGVTNWQANMDVLANQLIRVGLLGNPRTGKLVSAIFRSVVDQNTGTQFPAANSDTGVAGKWELINMDSYTYDPGGIAFPYGFTMNMNRVGDTVYVYPDSALTSSIPSGSRFVTAQETVPVGLRPPTTAGTSSTSGLTIGIVDEDGADRVDFHFDNNGTIHITSLNGFPSKNYLRGSSVVYRTPNNMIWAAGVPTN